MFRMTCARAFFYCHNISVIDFISKINIGVSQFTHRTMNAITVYDA